MGSNGEFCRIIVLGVSSNCLIRFTLEMLFLEIFTLYILLLLWALLKCREFVWVFGRFFVGNFFFFKIKLGDLVCIIELE